MDPPTPPARVEERQSLDPRWKGVVMLGMRLVRQRRARQRKEFARPVNSNAILNQRFCGFPAFGSR